MLTRSAEIFYWFFWLFFVFSGTRNLWRPGQLLLGTLQVSAALALEWIMKGITATDAMIFMGVFAFLVFVSSRVKPPPQP